MNSRSVTAVSSILLAVWSGVGVHSHPASESPSTPMEALESLTERAPEPALRVLEGLAESVADPESSVALHHSDDEFSVDVPESASGPIIVAGSGTEVAITLPFASQAEDAHAVEAGVVAFDNGNGSHSVPLIKDDGYLQIVTVIENLAAPQEYAYDFDLPIGATLGLESDSIVVRSSSGAFSGAVAPAWARDAAGRDVPTRYELRGDQVIQFVEHSAEHAYPIVADPTYAPTLFTRASVDSYQGQARVNLMPGPWTYAIAAPLMDVEGWNEATSRWGTAVRAALLSKGTMRQQFSCNAYGSWFAGEWNLERVRPTRTVHWSRAVASHRCNWTTATGA